MTLEHKNKRISDYFDSLPVQLILRFTAVAALTTVVAGLLILWLTSSKLEEQAWAQLDNGKHATTALYQAYHDHLVSLARLTVQRPAFTTLLFSGSKDEQQKYLQELQEEAEVDIFLACDSNNQLIAASIPQASDAFCKLHSTRSGYFVIENQAWVLASVSMVDQISAPIQVILGQKIDNDLTSLFREETGLEHSILIHDQTVATSLKSPLANVTLQVASARIKNPPNLQFCCAFKLDEKPYYATRLELGDSNLEAMIALDVSNIFKTRQQLIWIIAGSLLGATLISSVFGIIQARHIGNPLVNLADSAARFSQGDLSTRVEVQTRLQEVVQVARALEQARSGLQTTLSDLQNEKIRINHLLEAIIEGIVTCTQENKITFFSHGAERITGLGRDEVMGRSIDEVFKLVDQDRPISDLRSTATSLQRCLLEFPDGSQHTLSFSFAELEVIPGTPPELIIVFRDITADATVQRLLGQFLANISHEFRTPLSALAASIELLIDERPRSSRAETGELLKSLHLGILGLQNLVDNLIESASIEAGQFRVSPRPYEVEKIILEAANTMQPVFNKYGQHFILDLPPSIPLVQADPRRTEQVLVNLLANANKYGPSDGEIKVSVTIQKTAVRVQVADQGPGITSDQKHEIFRRFVYPPRAQRTDNIGAGLGLSVVKAVIEASSGQVGVEDNPAGGSIFWFTLPKAMEL